MNIISFQRLRNKRIASVAIFADLERLRRLGLAIPAPLELAARLRAAGLPLAPSAVTVEAIAAQIAHLLC